MRCPRCQSDAFVLLSPCPECGFTGDINALEKFSNVQYLLHEMDGWAPLLDADLLPLRAQYGRLLRQIQVELGLRAPIPDGEEVLDLWRTRQRYEALLSELERWLNDGVINGAVVIRLRDEATQQIAHADDRLVDAPAARSATTITSPRDQLAILTFLNDTLRQLFQNEEIGESLYQKFSTQYTQEIEALEVELGLREAAVAEPGQSRLSRLAARLPRVAASQTEPEGDRPPRQPWTWERVMETLLSERTLQAILFLGALLLFAAGVSWVAWNWGTFPPPVQIGFLAAFTALFYGLGVYVYRSMGLRGSGIALFGVASLLIPLDFYAFYLGGGFPPGSEALIWLIASLVCLFVYSGIAYLLHAEFFGYLIALALASVGMAGMSVAHVPLVWWQTAVSGAGFLVGLVGFVALRDGVENRFAFIRHAFRRIALLSVTSVMILGLGWRFFGGVPFVQTTSPLAVNYWLGGVVLALAVRPIRLPGLVWAASLAFPLAVWFTEQAVFAPSVSLGWYGLGLALLVPLYFGVARWLTSEASDGANREARVVLLVAAGLTTVSAILSFTDNRAAMLVHPLLALATAAAARLWRERRWLWLTGILLLSGGAALQGARGATLPELALPWGLLSILMVLAAVRLRNEPACYDAPLFGVAWLAALLAILPPALLNDRSMLVYAVSNWIGVNVWLATLAVDHRRAGLDLLLTAPLLHRLRERVFHWAAALSLLPWLVLIWTNGRSADWRLAVGYVVLAYLLLGAALWTRHVRWQYAVPWTVAAYLANVTGFVLAFGYDRPFWGGTLLGAGLFFFALALLAKQRWQFVPGALIFAYGWTMLATEPQLNLTLYGETIANNALVFLYAAVGFAMLWRGVVARLVRPFLQTTLVLGVINFLGNIAVLDGSARDEYAWLAIAFLLLAMGAALIAWAWRALLLAHGAVWLGVLAGGLLVVQYSRGSGRSAALAALLAAALVLSERGLHRLALRRRSRRVLLARQAWRLFRGPLLFAGWAVSLGAIGLALLRNLILLEGNIPQQTWSIVALTLLVALYGASAALFAKRRFVLFAGVVVFLPWTLLTDLGFFIWREPRAPAFGVSWAVLALLMLGTVWLLADRLKTTQWGVPLQWVATLVMGVGFATALVWTRTAFWASFLGAAFFALAVLLDRWFYRPGGWQYGRFLYPLLGLLPFVAGTAFDLAVTDATLTQFGLLTVLFALPALAIGRWVEAYEPSYRWPLYALSYGTAVIGMLLVQETQPVLIGILLFNAALTALSVWVFREPLWWYPSTLLLPAAGIFLLRELELFSLQHVGWLIITLGGAYLFGAWLLNRLVQARYATPLLVMSAVFGIFGLVPEETALGVAVGYAGSALLFAALAFWKQWPPLLLWSCLLLVVAYGAAMVEANLDFEQVGMAMWPGIFTMLAAAVFLDRRWGKKLHSAARDVQRARWGTLRDSFTTVTDRLLRWWALAPYLTVILVIPISSFFAVVTDVNWRIPTVFALGTAVYAFLLVRFWLWPFLGVAWLWFQFTWANVMAWLGWWEFDEPEMGAYFFLPMTVLTAVAAVLIEQGAFQGITGQKHAFGLRPQRRRWWAGVLYTLLVLNIFIGQAMAFENSFWTNVWVTGVHALLIAIIGTVWRREWAIGVGLLFGFVALIKLVDFLDWPLPRINPAYATLGLVYGASGYLILWRERLGRGRDGARYFPTSTVLVWKRPLIVAGWILSGIVLLLALGGASRLFGIGVRAAFGVVTLASSEVAQTQMLVTTLAILGLFYLVAALAERRPRWSYGALFLLLVAWSLWLRLLGQQVELQVYAIPASLYLLGIGWFEWQTGSQTVARWVDRVALLLLFGSVFWQSLTSERGAIYAMVMIVEGLLVLWWGSARRSRRLLYGGVLAVVVALLGQLIRPLLALNIVALFVLGALLVALGIILERQLEDVRALSQDVRQRLEHWE